MLGKYRARDFHANGTNEYNSSIAIRGGLNNIDRLGSKNTGYTRIEEPFIPFATLDFDFNYSPLFGDMNKLIQVDPKDYVSYFDSLLSSKYSAIINAGDDNAGIILQPSLYNVDMNYMVPFTPNGMISAAEWMYLKLYGVPSLDSVKSMYDTNNIPSAEPEDAKYSEEIDSIDTKIRALRSQEYASTDIFEAEAIRMRIEALEAEREAVISTREAAANGTISVDFPAYKSDNNTSETEAQLDPRITDLIRSNKTLYTLNKSHAYMISSIDLGDLITDYYTNENNDFKGHFNLKFYETADLKISRMMHGYMNATYDSSYMRRFLPGSTNTFNLTIYVHDVRSFFNNTPAGELLQSLKEKNTKNDLNSIAAEHTACLAICCMGCTFDMYANNFNTISMAGVNATNAQDTVDVTIAVGATSISWRDVHDLAYGL